MQTPVQPFTEPWRTTALRTGSLALAVGVIVGLRQRHFGVVPVVTLLALWFTLGGHFVEVLFRNRLGRYISGPPAIHALCRVGYWFLGGVVLFAGALATRALLAARMPIPFSWWQAGMGFVGVELLVHLGLRARGQPNVYDGRG